ncbi:hypothetical protein M3Y97_00185400 [Aphelenchoides bicaudatus]|nr:hypothetical protein M3Y97_00185400 [Aphelenchoides bicaudatus]
MDGKVFMSTEQYYFYRKAEIFGDRTAAQKLLRETDPMKAKVIGQNVKNFDKQKWDEVSYTIMKRAIFEKFKQHRSLKNMLLSTGNGILVEAAPYDTRWGVGLKQTDPRIGNMQNWRGTNLLGKALMEVRTGLQHKADERSEDIGLRKQGSDGNQYRIFYSIRNYFHTFYPTEVLYLDGKGFQSVQHYFAYTKAITFNDYQTANRIRNEPSALQAQRLSFSLKTSFDAQTWNAMSYNVMLRAVKAKFTQNDYLRKSLKETGNDKLVFADTTNLRWAAGLDANSPSITNPNAWRGENLLGKALEEVRQSL